MAADAPTKKETEPAPPSVQDPPIGTADGTAGNDGNGKKPDDGNGQGEGDGGIFDVPALLGGFKKTVGVLRDVPTWLTPSADAPKEGEPAPDATKKNADDAKIKSASAGYKHADQDAALYQDMLQRTSRLPLEPGRHPEKPAEGTASYVADAKGRVTEFTTAKGATYKNIKYDAEGSVIAYDAPSGHHFVRNGGVDKDGFGNWSCYDAQGRQSMYAGSNSYSWRGKVTADDSSFSTMIASGPNKGRLISRHADGTVLDSKLTERTADGGTLQTTVILPDGTQVVRDSKLSAGSISGGQQMRLLNADKTEETRIQMDAGGETGKVVSTEKVAPPPKTAAELAAEKKAADDKAALEQAGDKAKKIADKVLQKIGDNPDAIANLSAALKNMDHLVSATIKNENGKHKVTMHFDQGMTMPAINANIRGFRPGPTHVAQDISFTLSHTPEGFKLDDMQGFSGSVTRRRTRESFTNSMTIGRDQNGTPYVDVDSSVKAIFGFRDSSNRFGEQNFPEGSPMRQLMKHPDVLHEIAGALRMFQKTDDLKQITLTKNAKGGFDVNLDGTEDKHIPINQEIKQAGATVESIDLSKALSATLSHDKDGVRLTNMQGMSINLKGLLGDMKVTPKAVGLQKNAEGVPVVHIEIEAPGGKPGEIIPFDVPVSKLQELARKGK